MEAGFEKMMVDGLEEEALKRGLLRGGSQGLFLDMGTIVGECHRKALARMIGGEPEQKNPLKWRRKQWMFESGHRNEDTWKRVLDASPWSGPILRESEFPIGWRIETEDGAAGDGSGREDFILCYGPDQPGGVETQLPGGRVVRAAQLLELKQICSLGTAIDVLFSDGKPKLGHAIQAARYSLVTKLPSQIWYTNPFDIAIPEWDYVIPKIPRQGEKHSDIIEYSWSGKGTKIVPAEVGYHLTWHEGRLHYCRVGEESGGWTPTVITETGLDDFWRFTLDMPGFKDLGPRPRAMDIHGNKQTWSPCKYCEWKPVCDAHENNYDDWEAAVKERIPSTTSPTDKKKEED